VPSNNACTTPSTHKNARTVTTPLYASCLLKATCAGVPKLLRKAHRGWASRANF